MTPDELAEIGRAIFGERWQSSLARAVGIGDRHIRKIMAGEESVSTTLASAIEEFAARKRAHDALDLIAYLAKKEAHGRMPAEIALTDGRGAVGKRATAILAEALRAIGVAVSIAPLDGDDDDPAARAKRVAKNRA